MANISGILVVLRHVMEHFEADVTREWRLLVKRLLEYFCREYC